MKLRIAVVAVAALLAGCSTVSSTLDKVNPFTSSSAAKPKMADLTPIQGSASLHLRWQTGVASAAESEFSPGVVGPIVNAAAADGSIVRLDGGREVLRFRADRRLTGGVGADSQHLAVGTQKGEVLVFDIAGKLLWKGQVSSEILAAPVFAGNLVIVRSGDNRINAFDSASGKRVWTYQRPTPALSLRSAVGLTVAGNTAYAGFPGGKLVALSLANGAPVWEGTVALPKGTTELDRIADVTSEPAVDGRQVCAAAYQGRVACFDAGSGELLWARDISSSRGVDMDRQRVYVSDDKGAVMALDRDSGASLWKQDKLLGRGVSRPLSLGEHVAVADVQGVVHLLKKDDGSFAARIVTDGSPVLVAPTHLDGGFVIQTQKGNLYSMGL
ncbi:MAG: outer membrane protein assembly factor BamB [Rhodocyclaceae bacterium]|nr:outer membrane protein assembly factor BamB [Rhodocyclaceae bacterium]